MQINIITKRFLLAGFETAIDFNKGFDTEMAWIHSELKRSFDRIPNKAEPARLIGFWQPWQAFVKEADSKNTAKAKYFFGVEITGLENMSSDFVVKAIPEGAYAIFREGHRGTAPKAEMYTVNGCSPNYQIAGDFEIFDDFDHTGETDSCDVLVPVLQKT